MKDNIIKINNFNIHFIKTNKFNSIEVSIVFLNKINELDLLKRRILFDLLTYSTKKYSNQKELTIQKQDNYISNIYENEYIIGNYYANILSMSFLNDKYTTKNNYINCINLLKEVILNPNIENGLFDDKSFTKIFNDTKTTIKASKDNPMYYSVMKCLNETDKNNPISFGYNDEDLIDKITNKDIVDCYNRTIRDDKVDIFVVGNINENSYLEHFKDLKFGNDIEIKDIDYDYMGVEARSNIIKIKDDRFKQANLSISFKLSNLNDYEKNAVMTMFSSILGGGPSSKLFRYVREKNSLAYHISSRYMKRYDIMNINSGIEYSKYDLAFKLINEQISNMKKVSISELNIAKKTIINDYKWQFDSASSTMKYYYMTEVIKERTNNEKTELFKKVSKEDINNILSKVKIDTVLLLYGE